MKRLMRFPKAADRGRRSVDDACVPGGRERVLAYTRHRQEEELLEHADLPWLQLCRPILRSPESGTGQITCLALMR